MYIKQLHQWNTLNWKIFYKSLKIRLSAKDKSLIKEILTHPNKDYIENNFNILEKYWIINWIWPWYFPRHARRILTYLFKYVRYEWHDIMSSIWWTEKDRKRADLWLFYYSFKWNEWNILYWIIIWLLFNIVRIWWKSSFRTYKLNNYGEHFTTTNRK